MYDELIKQLREDVPKVLSNFDFDFVEDWIKVEGLIKEAADAIEELQKLLDGVSADNDSLCETIEELQKRVPKRPHGRLIDADALAAQCDDPYWCVWLSDIEDAPTIIEAEEGET